jgi:glycosyltransferase involved in cell wall biosynthesis
MEFASNYFKRFNCNPQIFTDNPRVSTGIIVVIPCYDDEFVFRTLDSLENADSPKCDIEVIVVVNSSENTLEKVVNINRKIYEDLKFKLGINYYKFFRLLPHIIENVPRKIAGVGNARKHGMDEAVRRFNKTEKPEGVIVSLDADTIVDREYFLQIEKAFYDSKAGMATFQFHHNFDKDVYSDEVINACKLYEIYLRYFRLSLKWSGFPYSIHTIGSCFAVRAEIYAKAGGMSKRQGGEDFYFLHKTVVQTELVQIDTPIVFPSPRLSDRVPFGTGPAVNQIIKSGDYKVYNFALFDVLKRFFHGFDELYDNFEKGLINVPSEIIEFVGSQEFQSIVEECVKHTSNKTSFIKRMFTKFDAFKIVKFLNSFDSNSNYPPENVLNGTNNLIDKLTNETMPHKDLDSIYSKILSLDISQE